jgi:hypothetical protein
MGKCYYRKKSAFFNETIFVLLVEANNDHNIGFGESHFPPKIIIIMTAGADVDQKATADGGTGDRPDCHGGHGRPPDRGQQAEEALQTLRSAADHNYVSAL